MLTARAALMVLVTAELAALCAAFWAWVGHLIFGHDAPTFIVLLIFLIAWASLLLIGEGEK